MLFSSRIALPLLVGALTFLPAPANVQPENDREPSVPLLAKTERPWTLEVTSGAKTVGSVQILDLEDRQLAMLPRDGRYVITPNTPVFIRYLNAEKKLTTQAKNRVHTAEITLTDHKGGKLVLSSTRLADPESHVFLKRKSPIVLGPVDHQSFWFNTEAPGSIAILANELTGK